MENTKQTTKPERTRPPLATGAARCFLAGGRPPARLVLGSAALGCIALAGRELSSGMSFKTPYVLEPPKTQYAARNLLGNTSFLEQ